MRVYKSIFFYIKLNFSRTCVFSFLQAIHENMIIDKTEQKSVLWQLLNKTVAIKDRHTYENVVISFMLEPISLKNSLNLANETILH